MKFSVQLNTSKLRRNRHLTQGEVARKSGLSKTTISNLESGKQKKIELETIARLCTTFHCTPNDLFDFKEKALTSKVHSQKQALKKLAKCLEYDCEFRPENLDKELSEL